MKFLISSLLFLTNLSLIMAQNGKATTVKKTFNRTTSVAIDINADVAKIWKFLTDAANYPKWNSTVISIDGNIQEGEKIKLKSTLDPSRTFKLKVKEVVPNKKLVWGDMMGKRTFTLSSNGNGSTQFSMSEKIGGLFFPLFANKIPSFDESFEQFAADLKKVVEGG